MFSKAVYCSISDYTMVLVLGYCCWQFFLPTLVCVQNFNHPLYIRLPNDPSPVLTFLLGFISTFLMIHWTNGTQCSTPYLAQVKRNLLFTSPKSVTSDLPFPFNGAVILLAAWAPLFSLFSHISSSHPNFSSFNTPISCPHDYEFGERLGNVSSLRSLCLTFLNPLIQG